MIKNQISSFVNNKVVVDFGNGNIVNLQDFASGGDVLDIKFPNNFQDPDVGVMGVASFRQTQNKTATLNLKLKTGSDENDHFKRWIINAENGNTTLINATVINNVRGEKITLNSGIIKAVPDFSEGDTNTATSWSIVFLGHTKNLI